MSLSHRMSESRIFRQINSSSRSIQCVTMWCHMCGSILSLILLLVVVCRPCAAFCAMQYVDIRKILLWVSTVSIVLFVACDFLSLSYNNNFSVLFFSSARRTQAAKQQQHTKKQQQLSTAQRRGEEKCCAVLLALQWGGDSRGERKRLKFDRGERTRRKRNTRKIRCVNRERAGPTAMMMMSHCLRPVRRSLAWSSLSSSFGVLCANKKTHIIFARCFGPATVRHIIIIVGHSTAPRNEFIFLCVFIQNTNTQQR